MPKKRKKERVSIFVNRDTTSDDSNEFVSVNGPISILPRGKRHTVSYAVAREYQRSQRAKEQQIRNSELIQEKLAAAAAQSMSK